MSFHSSGGQKTDRMCWQVSAPSTGSRGGSCLSSSSLCGREGPLPCGSRTPASASLVPWPFPPVLSLIRIRVRGGRAHCNLVNPMLTNYIPKDPISKSGHILRFRGGCGTLEDTLTPLQGCCQSRQVMVVRTGGGVQEVVGLIEFESPAA